MIPEYQCQKSQGQQRESWKKKSNQVELLEVELLGMKENQSRENTAV